MKSCHHELADSHLNVSVADWSPESRQLVTLKSRCGVKTSSVSSVSGDLGHQRKGLHTAKTPRRQKAYSTEMMNRNSGTRLPGG